MLGNAWQCLEVLTTFGLLGKDLHLRDLHLHTCLEDLKIQPGVNIDVRTDSLHLRKVSALIEINVIHQTPPFLVRNMPSNSGVTRYDIT
jgi:hypothetical protein